MGRLSVFNFVTLNGFFKGPNEDTWWHVHGGEEAEYSAESLKSGNILLFGRLTYEMMVGFWPTAMAMDSFPIVAEGMNKAEKIVFSRTLKKVEWNNTRLLKGDIAEAIKKLKQAQGKDLTVLGSGSIITQFAEQGLIEQVRVEKPECMTSSGTQRPYALFVIADR